MLVVDASCLFEVVADTPRSAEIAARLASETEQVAPELIDVEVLGVSVPSTWAEVLTDSRRAGGRRPARLAGERFAHRWMLDRVWQLRGSVRGWDAFCVTLAANRT